MPIFRSFYAHRNVGQAELYNSLFEKCALLVIALEKSQFPLRSSNRQWNTWQTCTTADVYDRAAG